VHIRYGLISERGPLEALQRRASLVWEDTRAALLSHPETIQIPEWQFAEARVRVAENESTIVGFSVIFPHEQRPPWELDGLFVEPSQWGRGIGRALIVDAAEIVRRERGWRLEVTANPNAEQFYTKLGFVESGRTKTQFGPGIRMRLDVK
jgi:GNAT superfamily N-acetyltransferase